MASNWGKKAGNFGGRTGTVVRSASGAAVPPTHVIATTKGGQAYPGLVDRVSEAMRNANAKSGFVRTDAKK